MSAPRSAIIQTNAPHALTARRRKIPTYPSLELKVLFRIHLVALLAQKLIRELKHGG